jgi:O-antigen/teichoic acid export membrane protein
VGESSWPTHVHMTDVADTKAAGDTRPPGLGSLVARDTVLYGVGHVLARSTYLILVPLLTRALAPAELGAVDLLTAGTAIAISLVSLEINQAMARFVPAAADAAEKRRLSSAGLAYAVVAFCTMAILTVIFADQIGRLTVGTANASGVVRAVAIYAAMNGVFLVVQGQLRWELTAGAFALTAVCLAFTSLAAIAWFVLVARAGVTGVFLGQTVGTAIGMVVALTFVRRSFGIVTSLDQLKGMLRFSVPLVPATFAAFISANADRFVISRMLGNAEVGIYGVGYRLASVVGLSLVAFQMALVPLIYSRYQRSTTPLELAALYRGFVVLAATAWLAVSLFAPELIGILATDAYRSSSSVVPFLAAALLITGMASFAPGLWIAGRTGTIAVLSIGTALLAVLLNIALVPMMGIQGAAIAAVTASVCGFAAAMVMSQRHYPVPYSWPFAVLAASLATSALLLGRLIPVEGLASMILRSIILIGVLGLLMRAGHVSVRLPRFKR